MDYYEEYVATGDPKYLDAYLGTIKPTGELVAADIRAGLASPGTDPTPVWPGILIVVATISSVAIGIVLAMIIPVHHAQSVPLGPPPDCPGVISLDVGPPMTSYDHWITGDHRKPATLREMGGMMTNIMAAIDKC